MTSLEEAKQLVRELPQADIDALVASTGVWAPLPGPQTEAYESSADILFYGGAAGGGKTDLLIGCALRDHLRSILFRREAPQLQGIVDRTAELVSRDGFNSQKGIWALPGAQQLELGSCPHLGNETRYQGRPHDLKGFDEICHFTETQFRFLIGWLRSTVPGQRKRVICTGNPPTRPEERWVIKYWGPWLDPEHPKPAKPGELRFYYTDPETGDDVEHPDGVPFKLHPDDPPEDVIVPLSRTFISSHIEDNPFLLQTGYKSVLQSMPEPLRSQMLKGDFNIGQNDHEFQVIPSGWVKAAMDRWEAREDKGAMTSMGVDPNRGGTDEMCIARRHGNWFDEMLTFPGSVVKNGPDAAALVVQNLRGPCPVNVDVIGYGSSCVDFLAGLNVNVEAMNGAAGTQLTDKTGRLSFANKRAQWWWGLREMLDPANTDPIFLPPDTDLLMDLCAPRYFVRSTSGGKSGVTAVLQVESKEDLLKASRLGRSPDRGDAVVYAAADMENWGLQPAGSRLGAEAAPHGDPGRSGAMRSRSESQAPGNDWNRPLDYSSMNKGII